MLCKVTHCTGRNVSLIASFSGPFWPGNEASEPYHAPSQKSGDMMLIKLQYRDTIKIQSFIFAREYHFIIFWPFQWRCSRYSRYQREWSSTESPAATLVICTTVWRPAGEKEGERRERGEREGEERISEKGGRQSCGYYLRALYVSFRASDCAATCTIWGWCLFKELRY